MAMPGFIFKIKFKIVVGPLYQKLEKTTLKNKYTSFSYKYKYFFSNFKHISYSKLKLEIPKKNKKFILSHFTSKNFLIINFFN